MKVLIAGAGPAGVSVAETLRRYERQVDRQVEIVMLSGEPFPPYSPPALAEYFLSGRPVHFWRGHDFAERLELEYRAGAEVTAVAPQAHTVQLAGGETLHYDKLVIATGGRLYAPVEGSDRPGVYNFKSLSAAEDLLQQVRAGRARTALIVGAGFIGVEIALLLRDLGVDVTLMVRSRIMRSTLDPETSGRLLALLLERGIRVAQGDEADAVAFLSSGGPRAVAVGMRSGAERSADLLVAATGLRPNVALLDGSGIETGWGVMVDDRLRTSAPDVYAAGDVAETYDRFTHERYVHAIFPNAIAQGQVVAYNLLGWDRPYEGADNCNSLKHLGLPVMAVGRMDGEELRVQRGDALRKLYLKDGRIAGFCLLGDVSAAGVLRALMNRQVDVSAFRERLLAPSFGAGYLEETARRALQGVV